MHYSVLAIIAAICAAGALIPTATAAPKITITKSDSVALPEIWKAVPAAKRLQYVRAAELDATRFLAERIMGISINGDTTVKDLATANDTVKGTLSATLKGVKTVGKPTYHEDGRVEVIRSVKIRSLVESITQQLNGRKQSVNQETVTSEIDALGNAAIPGSDGQARVMAKRAAELDVYRRLIERAVGVEISSGTTVRDFAVESDEIKAAFSNTVKSAEITSISYLDDNSAEVTATLKIGPLVRIITKNIAANGKVVNTTEVDKQLEIEETGTGAPPAPGEKAKATTAPTTTEIDLIINQTLTSNSTL